MKHHWSIGKKPNPDKYFGFIYEILNTLSGRKYIGKKQYKFKRRIKVPGRQNRKIVYTESGWEMYTGSSTDLNLDIKEYGKENFQFKILWQCSCKSMLYYKEVELLVKRNTLVKELDNGQRAYYNKAIPAVKFLPKGTCK